VLPLFHALGTRGMQLILSYDLRVPSYTSYHCPHVDYSPAVLHRHPPASTNFGRNFDPNPCLSSILTLDNHLRPRRLQGENESYKGLFFGNISIVRRPRRWCLGAGLVPMHSFGFHLAPIHWNLGLASVFFGIEYQRNWGWLAR
jgi:hypothetical protein